METKKEIMVGMLTLSVFVFIVSLSSLYVQTQISEGNACGCLIPLPLFLPFLASIGLFIGMLLYSLIFQSERKGRVPKELLLKCFGRDDRKVMNLLVKNQGEMLQSSIVKNSDLSKVKVHRIIKKLKQKGILEKEQYGKTNRIRLDKKFRGV